MIIAYNLVGWLLGGIFASLYFGAGGGTRSLNGVTCVLSDEHLVFTVAEAVISSAAGA